MAAFTGIIGTTSWTGTANALLLSSGAAMSFDLNVDALEFDTTAFSALGIKTYIPGLYAWNGTLYLRQTTAITGDTGLVAWSGTNTQYETNPFRWLLNVACAEHETTVFGATARTFIPGAMEWSGEYESYTDDTNAPITPPGPATLETLSMTVKESGATDYTLSGTAFTTRQGVSVSPQDVSRILYSFRGSGALAMADASGFTEEIFAAGSNVARPAAGTLEVTAQTGSVRKFGGSAFWTGVRINVAINQLTTIEVDFRGSGALTTTWA